MRLVAADVDVRTGVSAAISPITSSRNSNVVGLSRHSLPSGLFTQSVYGSSGLPSQVSFAYEASAECMWLGPSISGITVTPCAQA